LICVLEFASHDAAGWVSSEVELVRFDKGSPKAYKKWCLVPIKCIKQNFPGAWEYILKETPDASEV
jgi:hypothetical protein